MSVGYFFIGGELCKGWKDFEIIRGIGVSSEEGVKVLRSIECFSLLVGNGFRFCSYGEVIRYLRDIYGESFVSRWEFLFKWVRGVERSCSVSYSLYEVIRERYDKIVIDLRSGKVRGEDNNYDLEFRVINGIRQLCVDLVGILEVIDRELRGSGVVERVRGGKDISEFARKGSGVIGGGVVHVK